MKDIEKIFKDKQLRSPHTGIYFGIVGGSGASVSLIESMDVTGTVDNQTSITGSDGVTYKTRRFTSGTGTFTPTGDGQIQYLIVAGGGGGARGYDAGGGAGGYRTNATGEENPNGEDLDALLDVTDGTTYTVVVGAGGGNASQTPTNQKSTYAGKDSSITGSGITDSGGTNSIVAIGGGHGQRTTTWNNGQGGSGGGGRGSGAAPSSSVGHTTSPTVQGYPGSNFQSAPWEGGGGGGAGGAAASSGTQHGGAGRANAILTGSDVWYAGGGAGQGGGGAGNGSAGGAPYGGRAGSPSRSSQNGETNTGGGGGSCPSSGTGNTPSTTGGGSGVVIIRWQYAA